MRPLRLLLDGFGCYRQPAEADFTDVEFFALDSNHMALRPRSRL